MRFVVMFSLTLLATSLSASPWPEDASVAYVEELALACAKADPKSASNYDKQKNVLFSELAGKVEQARAMRTYPEMRKWARATIANATDLAAECHSFITDFNLALRQADPNRSEQIPAQ